MYKFKEWGDVSKIAARCGVTPALITTAFKRGKTSARVIDEINKFYLEVQPERQARIDRLKEIEKINEQING